MTARTGGTACLPPIISCGDEAGWRWAVLGQLACAVERIADALERQEATSAALNQTARRVERLLSKHPNP